MGFSPPSYLPIEHTRSMSTSAPLWSMNPRVTGKRDENGSLRGGNAFGSQGIMRMDTGSRGITRFVFIRDTMWTAESG